MIKKPVILVAIICLVSFVGSSASAANKSGEKCTTAGQIVKVSGKKLVCAKVAKNLKWVVVPAATAATTTTTTTIAPTTTVATTTTTTTTTIAASKVKPVVTLMRSYGTYNGVSLKVSYTVTGNKELNCTTLSKVLGEDFNGKRISLIDNIAQTTTRICTVTVEYSGERDGDTREIILSAAASFSVTDTDGMIQSSLLGSPQSIWATRPAP